MSQIVNSRFWDARIIKIPSLNKHLYTQLSLFKETREKLQAERSHEMKPKFLHAKPRIDHYKQTFASNCRVKSSILLRVILIGQHGFLTNTVSINRYRNRFVRVSSTGILSIFHLRWNWTLFFATVRWGYEIKRAFQRSLVLDGPTFSSSLRFTSFSNRIYRIEGRQDSLK